MKTSLNNPGVFFVLLKKLLFFVKGGKLVSTKEDGVKFYGHPAIRVLHVGVDNFPGGLDMLDKMLDLGDKS